jgi:uncharacterized integral membrane protein
MPWRLILFIVCLVVFAVFSVANAGNICTISFIVGKTDVPVVIALVIAFALGVFVTAPLAFIGRSKTIKKAVEAKTAAVSGQPAKEQKVSKKAKKNVPASSEAVPEFESAEDAFIREKTGQESPRGKF